MKTTSEQLIMQAKKSCVDFLALYQTAPFEAQMNLEVSMAHVAQFLGTLALTMEAVLLLERGDSPTEPPAPSAPAATPQPGGPAPLAPDCVVCGHGYASHTPEGCTVTKPPYFCQCDAYTS